jgi:hypothetical protein
MRLHILGICGTFMGGVAALARELGHAVEGSDANVYPPMSTQLEALGIDLMSGYAAAHLQSTPGRGQPDLIVVGNAMTRGNPAVEYMLDKNPARNGWARRCWLDARCWPWPVPTARPPPPACWHTCWKLRVSRRASWSAACRAISVCRRGWGRVRNARVSPHPPLPANFSQR